MSVAYRVVLRGPRALMLRTTRRAARPVPAALTVVGPSKQRGTRRTFLGNFIIFLDV